MRETLKTKTLRVKIRNNRKCIIENLVKRIVSSNVELQEICMFCGSHNELTKEHVLPRWVFENSPKRFFTTDINGLNQTYITTTIPACSICNSDILNSLEKYIQNIFNNRDIKKFPFSNDEREKIISWLEIIDYKFQILNGRRKFKASKEVGYVPELADIPLSVLRNSVNYSPTKVITEIQRSQNRISVKSKLKSLNSLVAFRTKNKEFHFFHHMDDFIFLELPKQQIAVFYFYKRMFQTELSGYEEAMKVINTFY